MFASVRGMEKINKGLTIHSISYHISNAVDVQPSFCYSVYLLYYLSRSPNPPPPPPPPPAPLQWSSALCLCVICEANGKYHYPASRLSFGLPVVLIISVVLFIAQAIVPGYFVLILRTKARIIHTCDNTIAIRGVGIVGRLSMLAFGPITKSRACMIS